ncbi:RNA-binding cell elongation regulator Jag/EloR [Bacillus horti]|uniref:RNA-binding protein KhpB n=1 Tax=Caldalkalibacillus horti TaxID=77523 RepID=A0ABT9W1H8_9BACI|nr:RNA-binding cell elongation regulator Jag/EloR [Bacillus horti]MDQ0167108.1 spoIIIJ-associated protein [Bacillus horti]
MNKVTARAKTVQEAVERALSQLQTTEEFVNIRVIEEPSKGFLGFGAKQAVIEVERKDSKVEEHFEHNNVDSKTEDQSLDQAKTAIVPDGANTSTADSVTFDETKRVQEEEIQEAIEEAVVFLENVLAKMDLIVKVKVEKQADYWLFDVSGTQLGLMIGRRGQTLDSLQYLTNIVANRHSSSYIRIVIDVENYRAKRKETLEQLADRVAKKVIRSGNKVALEPMNAAERKIIHTHLQDYAGVATRSDGQDPHRHIVVYPK